MRTGFIILLVLLILSGAYSATITGEVVEWYTFDKLNNVIVEINTVPLQRDITTNGEYSFEVGFGEYVISAEYYDGDELVYSDLQEIVVTQEGNFVVDLLMFPPLDNIEDELGAIDFNGIEVVPEESELTENEDYSDIVGIGIIVFAVIFGIIVLFVLLKSDVLSHTKKEEKSAETEELDEYAEEVLALLRRRGNRLTQKEIRDEIQGIGEAKISLIITELEAAGKVKKIKKGRGNIIVLKK